MSFRKSCRMPFDLLPSLGRVQPIRIRRQCVMRVRGFHNVGKAAQTDPKLLRYASTITKQKKCWELFKSLTGFKLYATTPNNMQQGVQTDAKCNIQHCWEFLANNVASVCTGLNWELVCDYFPYQCTILFVCFACAQCCYPRSTPGHYRPPAGSLGEVLLPISASYPMFSFSFAK